MRKVRKEMVAALAACVALGIALPAHAQVSFAPAGGEHVVATDAGARVEEIGRGVYVIIHEDATDAWPHGNTGVIVGRNAVFVLDSNYLPSRARADIALIRRITDKPVRFLATTHWHFDHNNGAIAYREAFPDVHLIAERNTARWLELNQVWWSRMSTAPDSARRAEIANLQTALTRGAGDDGVRFSEAERASRADIIARRQNEMAELEHLTVITPDRLFDRELRMNFEGVQLVLHDWGRANSPHDVTLYLPEQRILFTGDILVQSPWPYTGASWPATWAGVLRQIEAIPVSRLVPGHGPVMRDHTYTRQVRALMEATNAGVAAMIRDGKTLQQIQDTLLLREVRAAVPVWNGERATDSDWDQVRRALIERAWRCIRGQGGIDE